MLGRIALRSRTRVIGGLLKGRAVCTPPATRHKQHSRIDVDGGEAAQIGDLGTSVCGKVREKETLLTTLTLLLLCRALVVTE